MPHTVTVTPVPSIDGAEDYFFFDDDTDIHTLTFSNDADPIDPSNDPHSSTNMDATPLVFQITVDAEANLFLTGLSSDTFALLPGQSRDMSFTVDAMLNNILSIPNDALYGTRVYVQAYAQGDPGNILETWSFYVYRYLDVADADLSDLTGPHEDGVLDMPDAVADGPGGGQQLRPVTMFAAADAIPDITLQKGTNFYFDPSSNTFGFDPNETDTNLTDIIHFIDPDGNAGRPDDGNPGLEQQVSDVVRRHLQVPRRARVRVPQCRYVGGREGAHCDRPRATGHRQPGDHAGQYASRPGLPERDQLRHRIQRRLDPLQQLYNPDRRDCAGKG